MMLPLIIATVFLAVLELFFLLGINWLRRDFQWLITERDLLPVIDKDSLHRFLAHGFSPVLGWERKPGTQKTEEVKTVGEERMHFRKATYTINGLGARSNPDHEHLPVIVSTYGDSFAFSRHVEDHETWQWYLSEMTETNVLNFGVGNYGMDQALMRLKSKYNEVPSKVVIMMVVPETISRILNLWKHYSEYGNVLGFKGRFVLSNSGLEWLQNPVRSEYEFLNISKLIPWIQKHDECFHRKFRRDLFEFPYSGCFIRNARRHGALISALLARKWVKHFGLNDERLINRPWEIVLKRNFDFTVQLFQDEQVRSLMVAIAKEFGDFVRSVGAWPLLVMTPYLQDLQYCEKHGVYYADFFKEARRFLPCLDATESLREGDRSTFYVSNFYGAHLSSKGNRQLASLIYDYLCQNAPADSFRRNK